MDRMSPERWRRIQEILDAALDRSPEKVHEYLDRACAGDDALRMEVERLLRSCNLPTGRLDEPAAAAAASMIDRLAAATRALREGSRIGPYRILHELGRGGMGVVYLAERDDGQFRQRVALKLAAHGFRNDQTFRRFLEERRILASLEHPAIARLLDGGVTTGGLPYFAMEYVQGEPVDRYCDGRRLSIPARLELFQIACDAVQYAHGKLIVHRDLKASNILVTDDGRVKLLDFGIAKLLSPDPDRAVTGLTRGGARLMTPEYASPEQAGGGTISTASDVYSLGVLLYRLLTGRHPYRLKGLTPGEVERVISEEMPERPSTVVRRAPDRTADPADLDPKSASRLRGTNPARLGRRLRGDLDVITLKALRKEPERRYGSAERLAADVRDHLAGLPISARPDTWKYRSRKFVGRHRVGIGAFAVATLSLVGGIAGTAWQARIAAEERDRARLEAAKAASISEFLVGLFEVSDPDEARGSTITARELLDEGAVRIGPELAGEPDVQASLMAVIGNIYRQLGLYDEARPLLERSLEVRRELHGDEHFDVSASMNDLALLAQATGDYSRAEELYRQSLAIKGRLTAGPDSATARTLNNLALLLQIKGRLAPAESLYEASLAMTREVFGDRHFDVAQRFNNLGSVRRMRGDYDGAEPLLRRALDLKRELLGSDHLSTANSMNQLAVVLQARGRFAAAESLYRETLHVRQEVLGAEHPRVAVVLNDLGSLHEARKRYAAADSAYSRALAIFGSRLGPAHPHTGVLTGKRAAILHLTGDSAGAEVLYRDAIAVLRAAWPADHPELARLLVGLGVLLVQRGDAGEAEPLLRRALAIRRRKLERGDWKIAEAESALGACLSRLGRTAEGERLLVAATRRLERAGVVASVARRRSLVFLANHYRRTGRDADAARLP